MNSARWLLLVLLLWLGATIWSNALEPAKTDLLPATVAETSGEASTSAFGNAGLYDSSLATPSGFQKVFSWVKILFKALSFDYAWFDGWIIGSILRIICIIFSIAGLYFVLDIIWKVRSIVFGG